jgi:Raf kinase inhibitor-like YbhB/YbcL family protein
LVDGQNALWFSPSAAQHFANGQRIPTKYPPLDWSDAPAGTESFLLVVEDPDAPRGTFHHWGLYNLKTRGVPEGFASADREDDIETAINDFGEADYCGPAPPPGHGTHHYHFKVAALNITIDPPAWAKVADVWHFARGHIIDEAELVGTYAAQWRRRPGPELPEKWVERFDLHTICPFRKFHPS